MIRAKYNGFEAEPLLLVRKARALVATSQERLRKEKKNLRSRLAQRLLLTRRRLIKKITHQLNKQYEEEVGKLSDLFSHAVRSQIEQLEEESLELCLSLCKEVLQEITPELPKLLAKKIEHQIRYYQTSASRVEVHPSQRQKLQELLACSLHIEENEEIDPGNFKLITAGGVLEVRWQDHFSHLTVHVREKFRYG